MRTSLYSLLRSRGFTLMELLVVLLIIGILSTVALRTIDATRDRALFDQTAKELNQLAQAVTGNPDLTYDGRRTDFGYFGDVGQLPTDPRELVKNINSVPNWHGPYIRAALSGDSLGYLTDAWGHPYEFNWETGTITSLGNGKFPLSVRFADSTPQLTQNSISGTLVDLENNPPGDRAGQIPIFLHFGSGGLRMTTPDPGGYYEFSPANGMPVPIGTHRVAAVMPNGDSIARWVTVAPRSRVVLDMRYSKAFRSRLVMVGTPGLDYDSSGFWIQLVNEGTVDDTVSSVLLAVCPESAYMRSLWFIPEGASPRIDSFTPFGYGLGNPAPITPPYSFPANRSSVVTVRFWDFKKDSSGTQGPSNIGGQPFRIRFSDGSEITVTP